ncbi:MAG: CooT family nickel-binding protein [Chloroflexi bacterium]|nr:CooT family nickel-binding protein [Chloroflexota bacterium]
MSRVYLEKDGQRTLLLEDVATIKTEAGGVLLKSLFGEEKEVAARIAEIDFMAKSIVLQETV